MEILLQIKADILHSNESNQNVRTKFSIIKLLDVLLCYFYKDFVPDAVTMDKHNLYGLKLCNVINESSSDYKKSIIRDENIFDSFDRIVKQNIIGLSITTLNRKNISDEVANKYKDVFLPFLENDENMYGEILSNKNAIFESWKKVADELLVICLNMLKLFSCKNQTYRLFDTLELFLKMNLDIVIINNIHLVEFNNMLQEIEKNMQIRIDDGIHESKKLYIDILKLISIYFTRINNNNATRLKDIMEDVNKNSDIIFDMSITLTKYYLYMKKLKKDDVKLEEYEIQNINEYCFFLLLLMSKDATFCRKMINEAYFFIFYLIIPILLFSIDEEIQYINNIDLFLEMMYGDENSRCYIFKLAKELIYYAYLCRDKRIQYEFDMCVNGLIILLKAGRMGDILMECIREKYFIGLHISLYFYEYLSDENKKEIICSLIMALRSNYLFNNIEGFFMLRYLQNDILLSNLYLETILNIMDKFSMSNIEIYKIGFMISFDFLHKNKQNIETKTYDKLICCCLDAVFLLANKIKYSFLFDFMVLIINKEPKIWFRWLCHKTEMFEDDFKKSFGCKSVHDHFIAKHNEDSINIIYKISCLFVYKVKEKRCLSDKKEFLFEWVDTKDYLARRESFYIDNMVETECFYHDIADTIIIFYSK